MSDFKAKMHQNRFRLGLRPRPPLGELTAFPRPPSWIKGLLLRKGEGIWEGRGRGGKGGEKREGRGRGGRGGEGDGGKGEGRAPPIFYCTPQFQFSRNMPALERKFHATFVPRNESSK